MMVAKTFEESSLFDPSDPQQVQRKFYGFRYGDGYGGWQSTYFNRTADAGTLKGLGRALGNATWSALPAPVQIGVVGLASAAAGYLLMAKFGDSHIKPALRRIGIMRR